MKEEIETQAGAVVGPPEASGTAVPDAGEAAQATTQEAAAPAVAIDAIRETQNPHPNPLPEGEGTEEPAAGAASTDAVADNAGTPADNAGTPADNTPPDRELAAQQVVRFLGKPSHVAAIDVTELNDAEAWEVVRAAADRATAKEQIVATLNRAYDRRRQEAAEKVKAAFEGSQPAEAS